MSPNCAWKRDLAESEALGSGLVRGDLDDFLILVRIACSGSPARMTVPAEIDGSREECVR
jgi:hypothetical protein